MKNKIISLLLIIFLLIPSFCFPQQKEVDTEKDKVVAELEKGEKAPYKGILLTKALSAEIKQKLSKEYIEKTCKIYVETCEETNKNVCEAKMNICKKQLEYQKEIYEASLQEKKKEIEKYKKLSIRKWYEDPRLWFGIGSIAGAVIVYGAIKVTNSVSR